MHITMNATKPSNPPSGMVHRSNMFNCYMSGHPVHLQTRHTNKPPDDVVAVAASASCFGFRLVKFRKYMSAKTSLEYESILLQNKASG